MSEANWIIEWRRTKKGVKRILEKYGLTRYDADLIESMMRNKEMLNEIWALGISSIRFDMYRSTNTSQELSYHLIGRDNGPEDCKECINPSAIHIGRVYKEDGYGFSEDYASRCNYLWAVVSNRETWKPQEITVDILPKIIAHQGSKSPLQAHNR